MNSLEKIISAIRHNLKSSDISYSSEQAVREQIVMPILTNLGWETWNPRFVIPEYYVRDRKVDYALLIPGISETPKSIVEVKAIGKIDAGDEQLFEYAYHTGVPLAILTDGKEWRIYLPMEPGSYKERLVRTIDIANDVESAATALMDFLSYENIESGRALEIAREISVQRKQRDIARSSIEDAWKSLTSGEDAQIVDLVINETSKICGYPPIRTDVERFLNVQNSERKTTIPPAQVSVSTGKSNKPKKTKSRQKNYWLFNEEFTTSTYAEAYIHILDSVARQISYDKLDQLDFVFKNKDDIGHPYFDKATSIKDGSRWIHTLTNSKLKDSRIEQICKAASVTFGQKSGVLILK